MPRQDSQVQDDDFFEGKRPWSVIKDEVLRTYLPVYLAKVQRLNRRVLLVDGYAGPGRFGDGTDGSPLIMLRAAEQRARGKYEALFINNERSYDAQLRATLAPLEKWSGRVRPTFADSYTFLGEQAEHLADFTVFLYLDPFGMKGCGFDILLPYLTRDHRWSTEIVLTMSMPILHRLAGRHAVQYGQVTPQMASYHQTLTTALGGDEWQGIMWDEARTAEEKEWAIMRHYHARIQQYMPYGGFCPVRQSGDGSRIKYFMLFASRHLDALEIMNDAMARAYFHRTHDAEFGGTLLRDLDWRELRRSDGKLDDLPATIAELVAASPGSTRNELWLRLISTQFMRYTASEYLAEVKRLVRAGSLLATYGPTGRLNDVTRLRLPD
ncbi:MAG: three-Cys-motif partner protein TcmP [Ktedonobacterales bacterium]|nr:three-Cys-motif partner protein TcmP [Ktedonobacterales bacterium]